MYPHFIGIGAQKAGTTWLSRNLQMHPEVWMPPVKEVHYFDEKMNDPGNPAARLFQNVSGKRDRDRRWRRQVRRRTGRHLKNFSRQDALWDLKYYAGRPDDGWYASLFEPGRGKTAGEITPAYSTLDPDAVAHVHSLAPEAKIILMLRNPIERAWSQAAMRFDKAGESAADAAGTERLRRLFEREGSRSRTDYLRALENWGAYYPEDRIFVGFLEDVHFFPEELLRRVYDFLGVDPTFEPPGLTRKVHTRSVGRVPTAPMSYLASSYGEETSRLAERFGGYASFWLYCATRLASDPPPEPTIPYPLWESSLWEEWAGSGGGAILQSGTLAL
ncbi:sulfotransferase [Rubrobacter tropicus]|uniref:sulfotransferase n=1 Tax=Rubrobacter tropicus TaxID=2653851 RepID=UPI00140D732A|nr:sulfotransferase [Rubrobacter tropicus]